MGKDKRSSQLTSVGDTAGNWYNNLMRGPTSLESEYAPQSQQMWDNYTSSVGQNMQDYSNIMGGYQNFYNNLGDPTKFGFERVNAERPAELDESYGYLREAMPGYREFAQTGGYSPTDIQELRARGVSPIRSAYSNTMMKLNRARALGGAGGAPNYIAAASRAQREMPGQMADAMTGVNAQLADAIRQGKLAGLGGITNIGGIMGGLSSQEAGRLLQAAMSNQNADLQAQQLSEQSLQNLRNTKLNTLQGQTSLYGTTPGLSSMFGSQALQAYQNRINLEQLRNQTGLGLLGRQIEAYGGQAQQDPWWKQALNAAGSVLPYLKTSNNQNPSGSTPMGSYSPNNMGGNQFTGYQSQMPTGNQGNMTGNVSSNYSFPEYGNNWYSGGGGYDPYTNSGNWYGYGPATNGQQFSGWEDPWSEYNNYGWEPGDLMYDW